MITESAYFDKKHEVRFKQNSMLGDEFLKIRYSYKDGDLHCQFGHPEKKRVMAYKKNDVPFCCQYCTKLSWKHTNTALRLYVAQNVTILCVRGAFSKAFHKSNTSIFIDT
jgi:hypothetical protein